MKNFKIVNVVMLPTSETTSLFLHTSNTRVGNEMLAHGKFQNFYFTIEDEIKAGDIYFNGKHSYVADMNYQKASNDRKLIATTNKKFREEKNLPKPTFEFCTRYIEEYDKGNIITEVFVEYDMATYDKWFENGGSPVFDKLKINEKDNTINIKLIKNNFTRDEVIKLLHTAWFKGALQSQNPTKEQSYSDFIAENI